MLTPTAVWRNQLLHSLVFFLPKTHKMGKIITNFYHNAKVILEKLIQECIQESKY